MSPTQTQFAPVRETSRTGGRLGNPKALIGSNRTRKRPEHKGPGRSCPGGLAKGPTQKLAGADRHDHRGVRRLGPRALGYGIENGPRDSRRPPLRRCAVPAPAATPPPRWRRPMPPSPGWRSSRLRHRPHRPGAPGCRPRRSGRAGRRAVLAVAGERLGGDPARFFGALRFAAVGAERAEQRDAPLADHLLGDVDHGRDDTVDALCLDVGVGLYATVKWHSSR